MIKASASKRRDTSICLASISLSASLDEQQVIDHQAHTLLGSAAAASQDHMLLYDLTVSTGLCLKELALCFHSACFHSACTLKVP